MAAACAWDAMSDPEDQSQWQAEDVISRGYKHDPEFLALVANTMPVRDLDVDVYDALVVAGGQGPMFTFETATDLQQKFVEFYETGKVTAALCHGTAILAFATLSNGAPLVQGKTITGFPNVEEDLADSMTWEAGALPAGQHIMPWRIEDALKRLGANYIQAGAFRSFAIRDGNLVTGQQNYSGAESRPEDPRGGRAMRVAVVGAGRIGGQHHPPARRCRPQRGRLLHPRPRGATGTRRGARRLGRRAGRGGPRRRGRGLLRAVGRH